MILDANEHEISSIVESYVLSNTPAYLFSKLSSNPAVRRLADKYDVETLMAAYRDAAQRSRRTATDVALGYAALVAVTMKDANEARTALEQLSSYHLDWGAKLTEMFLSRPFTSQVTTVPFAPQVTSAQLPANDASVNRIEVPARSELVPQ